MVLKRVWPAAAGTITLGAVVLASSGFVSAQPYQPGEFLNLDLAKAVLSPKPLGPATGFTPGPLDVTIDRGNNATQNNAELMADPKDVATATVHAGTEPTAKVNVKATVKVAHRPRTLVALHGRNPVEARAQDTQARDTGVRARIQTWPCKSGGICDWKR